MTLVSRRHFLESSLSIPLAAHPLAALAIDPGKPQLLLVGTRTGSVSKGIYTYRFDSVAGELHLLGLAAETENPTFLTLGPNGKTVFAINEVGTFQGQASGGISSFLLDRGATRLKPVNERVTRGNGPCHVATDRTGRCVFAANYGDGSAASYRADARGKLSEAVSLFQYIGSGPNRERQTQPRAHRVTVSPENRFVMVCDLGLDLIHIYRLDADTATLTPHHPSSWKATAGSGPRAMQFHPNGRWAYCVTELASTVNTLHWDARYGTLDTVQEISMLPDGYTGNTGGADIVVESTGHFAYAANRGNDFLATFAISQMDGRLTLMERSPCGGRTPRHLTLDKSERWLLVANEDTDAIAVFARDPATGKLAHNGASVPLEKPQCLVFA